MPTQYTSVHLERRRQSGWQLYEAVGVARGDREASARQAFKNFELFGAPHAAIITIDATQGPYAALRCAWSSRNVPTAGSSRKFTPIR